MPCFPNPVDGYLKPIPCNVRSLLDCQQTAFEVFDTNELWRHFAFQQNRELWVNLQFWFMFPVSIAVAAAAMASGIEGATFFAPIFILVLRLPPNVAIGTGLITQVFGVLSGLYAFRQKKLIDYRLGGRLLAVSIPFALVGTWLSTLVDPSFIRLLLIGALLVLGISYLKPASTLSTGARRRTAAKSPTDRKHCVTTAEGDTVCYDTGDPTEGRIMAGLGGLSVGMLSSGLGGLNGYFFLRRCGMPAKISVATSVYVVAITALVASSGHVLKLMESGETAGNMVLSLIIFTIPGALIGAQVGSRIASRIQPAVLERVLGSLFMITALLMAADLLF